MKLFSKLIMIRKLTYLLLTLSFSCSLFAQNDSLTLKNGDVIIGEIKGMTKGVLKIETDYSDKDFEIEWGGIKKLYSPNKFLISLSDGKRVTASIHSTGDGKIILFGVEDGGLLVRIQGDTIHVKPEDIVYINSLDDTFLSRLSASIDVGVTISKANNQRQFTSNSRIGYLTSLWSLDLYYNSLFTSQDSVSNIERNDGGSNFKYFLQNDYYFIIDITFLSNTEQAIDLRSNFKGGLGKYLLHTNEAYIGVSVGAGSNIERFTNETPDKESWEGYFGVEVNLFDIGDFNLYTSAVAFPSITEQGRWRSDIRFDAKYDDFLLKDFYIRAGITINYDNQPAIAGNETDYVFTTGFGWSW